MCKAFNYKLYLLRQLKRCCTSIDDLLSVYTMYVRPTIEYACPVWYSSLTKSQLGCLEKLQRKALRIILSYDYCETKSFAEIYSQLGLPAMDVRLEQLFVNFGKSLLTSDRYKQWLPPPRNNNLRNPNKLCTIKCRTTCNRFKNSCIPSLVELLNHQ